GRDVLRRAVWALAQLRAGRSLTAPALASYFEVSLRTAYRYFDFLRDDWNVPIEFDYSRGTYRLTAPTALVAPITLSRGEIVALFFAEKVLAQYRGTPFEADLETALRKVRELLPEEVSVSPGVLDACLSLDPGPTYRPDPRIFADVLDALSRRRVALVRYRSLSGGRTTDRRIHPCHVFNHRGDWYVAAWDETRRQVRDFALHRILRISLTHDACEVPVDFDFRRYGGDAFGIEKGARPVDVVIRFAPRQARWIRERPGRTEAVGDAVRRRGRSAEAGKPEAGGSKGTERGVEGVRKRLITSSRTVARLPSRAFECNRLTLIDAQDLPRLLRHLGRE